MPRHHSKYALYSGYSISRQDFEQFMKTIHSLEPLPDKYLAFETCLSAYNSWRYKVKDIPKTLYVYDDDPNQDPDLVNVPFATVTAIFFPLRYIDYTGEEQLKDANVMASISTESEHDIAKRDHFLTKLNSEEGKLDESKLSFRWLKDTHPERIGYW